MENVEEKSYFVAPPPCVIFVAPVTFRQRAYEPGKMSRQVSRQRQILIQQ